METIVSAFAFLFLSLNINWPKAGLAAVTMTESNKQMINDNEIVDLFRCQYAALVFDVGRNHSSSVLQI